jgi:hypothetical protein
LLLHIDREGVVFTTMNPELTDLYAGLSGISLVPTTYDLGHGIQISQTYAHFMAPFLMAFKPPSPGKPHPAPWKSARGGLAIDIAAELFLPLSYRPEDLDRLNTIWWIVALLRLKVGASVFVPVVSSERFASIPSISEEPELLPIEIHLNRLVPYGGTGPGLGTDDLEWLRSHWEPGSQLLKNEDFSTAFISVDSCLWNCSSAVALVMIWGALERLFSTSHQELSFRVSANLATFLEVPGRDRLTCFKRVRSLYDSRSRAAHGANLEAAEPFVETYALARRALLKMIENRHVPTKNELEGALFGDLIGIVGDASTTQ